MLKLTRKRSALLAAIGVLSLSAVAFAYWTTSGSGSGSGTVGDSTQVVSLVGSVAGDLVPGGDAGTISFTASNPSDTDLRVNTISLGDVLTTGCDTGWFSMTPVAANQTIPANSTDVPITATGTVSYLNNAADQNACRGEALSFALSSN